jgi:hypothetical protein
MTHMSLFLIFIYINYPLSYICFGNFRTCQPVYRRTRNGYMYAKALMGLTTKLHEIETG